MADIILGAAANWSVAGGYATGIGTMTGADGVLASGTLTPTVSPAWTVNALVGRKMSLGGTLYDVSANSATAATITSPPADATYTYIVTGPPLSGDTISLNGYALTLDGSNASTYTCVSIAARVALGGAASAGTIVPANATSTIAANVSAGTVDLITLTSAANRTLTINGTLTGGTATSKRGIYMTSGTHTIAVTSIVGGTADSAYAMNLVDGTLTALTVTTATASANAPAIATYIGTNTTITNAVAAAQGAVKMLGGTWNVTNATGGSAAGAHGVSISGGTCTVTKAKGGSVAGAYGIGITGGTGVVNGVDLTGTGYPVAVNGGILKMAAGIPLQFSDAAGALKVFCPVPTLNLVVLDTVLYTSAAGSVYGTLASSIVDSAGAVSAGPGILDGDGDVYPSGVLEADTGIYGSYGVVDIAGVAYEFGILSNDGIVHEEGVLEDSGVNYYALASEDSTPYLAGFEAGGGVGVRYGGALRGA